MTERSQVWALVIAGQFKEPFLAAALSSVDWVDRYVFVNTAPETLVGKDNETVTRSAVPAEKLTVQYYHQEGEQFDFAAARNLGLSVIPDGAYVLIVDSDDVHWPEFKDICWSATLDGYDILTAHYWHLAVYKDLLHSQKYREILFRKQSGVRFENTEGGVHEVLVHPRENPTTTSYCYSHYGYVKSPQDVAARWEFYRSLGAHIHDYDVSEPEHALDDWPRICKPHWHEHPPAVRELLESWPSAPKRPQGKPRVGLVLLTWNDAENLKNCLPSLATTYEPFKLVVVDNGSDDGYEELLERYVSDKLDWHVRAPDQSLSKALNIGFGYFMQRVGLHHIDDVEYVGWIHPDHTFIDPEWLGTLVKQMDAAPEWAKLGCQESQEYAGLREGNSQCFIIRKSALEKIGLFNDEMHKCGGYEDWLMNWQLMQEGWKVMITPGAVVHHDSMGTRKHHDNVEAAQHNACVYHSITGTWEQPC